MVRGANNTARLGRAVLAAAAFLCFALHAAEARGQHASVPAPRASAPPARPSAHAMQPARPQAPRAQNQGRTLPQNQFRPQGFAASRPTSGYPPSTARPVYPGLQYVAPGAPRSAYPGYPSPSYAPPGHLGDWLNQHRNLPVQDQERMLRSDPTFSRLAPADQQRVARQLNQVNQLPDEQRQRRLARAEVLERMSPQERIQVSQSAGRWAAQPPERQAIMKNAFRDLRAVPQDQRMTVLNSQRYKGTFSAEERSILSDMLRVEPFEPAR